jgi:hypothetical protein
VEKDSREHSVGMEGSGRTNMLQGLSAIAEVSDIPQAGNSSILSRLRLEL